MFYFIVAYLLFGLYHMVFNLELDPNENKNLIGTGEKIEEILWTELQNLISKRD